MSLASDEPANAREKKERDGIREAFRSAGANVTIADRDYNIIDLNPPVTSLLKQAEQGLHNELVEWVASDGKASDTIQGEP